MHVLLAAPRAACQGRLASAVGSPPRSASACTRLPDRSQDNLGFTTKTNGPAV
jgi:hypothetical protein